MALNLSFPLCNGLNTLLNLSHPQFTSHHLLALCRNPQFPHLKNGNINYTSFIGY